jgi:hypothetical protein
MDSKSREIPLFSRSFVTRSPLERASLEGHGMVPLRIMRALKGPDSPLQKGGKHWGPPRKSWLVKFAESLWRGRALPPGVCAPEGILAREGGSQGGVARERLLRALGENGSCCREGALAPEH